MITWSLLLLAIAMLVFLVASAFVRGARWFLAVPGSRGSGVSSGRLAGLLGLALLLLASCVSLMGDETNAMDFAIIGLFLLVGGVGTITLTYLRPSVERATRTLVRRLSVQTGSTGRTAGAPGGIIPDEQFQAGSSEQACVDSVKAYLVTKDPAPLARTLKLLDTFENSAGRYLKVSRNPGSWFFIIPILVLALGVRLYHLDEPPVGIHSWRQAETAAMARNFQQYGFNLLYPQVDWGGTSPGYVESEFPIYPFLVGLAYEVFGFSQHWGRLLSAAFWLVAIYVLFLLVTRYLGMVAGLWTAFLLSVLPAMIYYSRAILAESMLIMSLVLGMYLFSEWLARGGAVRYLAAAFFLALACLIKLPALHIALPLAYLAWVYRGRAMFGDVRLWILAAIVVVPVALWYHHAHQLYLESDITFGIWDYGSGKWGNWGMLVSSEFWIRVLGGSLSGSFLTWAGLPLVIAGLVIRRRSQHDCLFDVWLLSALLYVIIVARGNYVHEYYQLMVAVPVTIFMGKALAKHLLPGNWRNWRAITSGACLAGILVLSLVRYSGYMRSETADLELRYFSAGVQARTPSGTRLIAVDHGDPTLLCLTQRKGWHAWPDRLDDSLLAEEIAGGAEYLVAARSSFASRGLSPRLDELIATHDLIWSTDNYVLIQLSGQRDSAKADPDWSNREGGDR